MNRIAVRVGEVVKCENSDARARAIDVFSVGRGQVVESEVADSGRGSINAVAIIGRKVVKVEAALFFLGCCVKVDIKRGLMSKSTKIKRSKNRRRQLLLTCRGAWTLMSMQCFH